MIILERIPFAARPTLIRDGTGAWRFEWCGLRVIRLTYTLDALLFAAKQEGANIYALAQVTEEADHGRTLH